MSTSWPVQEDNFLSGGYTTYRAPPNALVSPWCKDPWHFSGPATVSPKEGYAAFTYFRIEITDVFDDTDGGALMFRCGCELNKRGSVRYLESFSENDWCSSMLPTGEYQLTCTTSTAHIRCPQRTFGDLGIRINRFSSVHMWQNINKGMSTFAQLQNLKRLCHELRMCEL